MRDMITRDRVEKLHPKIRTEVVAAIDEAEANLTPGTKVRVSQGLRTFPEQDAIYAQGRTRPGYVVTKAKGGQSFHNYGLAVDFCIIHPDGSLSYSIYEDMDKDGVKDWDEIQLAFSKRGFALGERFNDNPHVDKVFGLTWQQCLELHSTGKVDANGYILI